MASGDDATHDDVTTDTGDGASPDSAVPTDTTGSSESGTDATTDGARDAADGSDDAAVDLCKGPDGKVLTGEQVIVSPNPVKLGGTAKFWVVSSSTLPQLRLDIGGSYCAGGAGMTETSAGPGCAGWHAVTGVLTTGAKPLAAAGTYVLTFYVNNPAVPCTLPYDRAIKGSITVSP